MTGPTIVFVDASVFVAAAGSVSGGSAAALTAIKDEGNFRAAVRPDVMEESKRNIRRKLASPALQRHEFIVEQLRPLIVSSTLEPTLLDLPAGVAAKDLHVVYGCLEAGASICLTLDRRHLLSDELQAWGASRNLRFLTPGTFLAEIRARESGASSIGE